MIRPILTLLVLLLFLLMPACTSPQRVSDERAVAMKRAKVEAVLRSWHLAASQGLFEDYFDTMTGDAVFLGTDPGERWRKDEFMAYAREPFADGDGWTYEPIDTRVALSRDATVAWTDELLEHELYGVLRGTGVLEQVEGQWKIAHYSLTFLVPTRTSRICWK